MCPICSKRAKVPVPTYIFERKKAGIIKIQIHAGIVCEHQFVAFIDQKFVARGYERIDFQLEISPRAPGAGETGAGAAEGVPAPAGGVPEVSIGDIVSKFGSFASTYLLHANIFNFPMYLVVSPTDAPNLGASLNRLLRQSIPSEIEYDDLVTQIDRKKFLKVKIINEEFLVLDTNGIVLNSPWGEKKKMSFEEYLIRKAMDADEEEEQVRAIVQGVRELYQRAQFAKDKLESVGQIYESDLKDALSKQFGIKHSDYQLDLVTLLVRRRFKRGEKLVKKIRIRSFDKLKEGLW